MSTTELATIDTRNYLALSDNEELRQALAAASDAGESITPSDLVRVPTPAGGATQWSIPGPAGDEVTPEITGVLAYYQPCGILWPGTDPQPGAMPVLRTWAPTDPNGVAEQYGPIPTDMERVLAPYKIGSGPPATYRWADLPYNQWGSGKGGAGKLCKEQRMLFILREKDVFPLLVTAQPGSVKGVSKFFKQLTPAVKVPYWRCVVSLRLEKALNKGGQPYARIVPKLVGTVPSDVGAIIKEKWTDTLARVVRRIDPVEPRGDADDE